MLGKPENPKPCLASGGITKSLIRISSCFTLPRIKRIVSLGYVSIAELRILSATDFSNLTRLIMKVRLRVDDLTGSNSALVVGSVETV